MIQLRRLSKTYRDGTCALAALDLEFGDGVLGLLGPNGAGKTTLLSMLVLALEPSQGTRSYFGTKDTASQRATLRGWIGYLAQEFETIPGLTGREYLRTCARLRQVPLSRRGLERRIDQLLDAVGLLGDGSKDTATYSGGMRRRLGLAQALVHAPRLLVVDEPTAGLDPEERIRFRNIITELGDRIPIVLSTHIVEDIEATCPRIAVLALGNLIFDGSPGELFARADSRVWRLAPGEDTGSLAVIGRRSDGAPKVGATQGAEKERADKEIDRPQHVVLSSTRPSPGATQIEPSLEEAYAAFLAETQAAPPSPGLRNTDQGPSTGTAANQ